MVPSMRSGAGGLPARHRGRQATFFVALDMTGVAIGILEGELAPGERLRERDLTERHGVARHSVRAALRALRADGLVTIEPHRGARVASLDQSGLRSLFELRTALELEAAHLALERHDGRLPDSVRAAVCRLAEVCARPDPAWSDVTTDTTTSTASWWPPRAATASLAPTTASPARCACSSPPFGRTGRSSAWRRSTRS
jgi:hypothetical protein